MVRDRQRTARLQGEDQFGRRNHRDDAVGSLAVSLAVFVSPPETVTVFVTLAGALPATATVTVKAG